jgi:zinc transport system substrate-binding protein
MPPQLRTALALTSVAVLGVAGLAGCADTSDPAAAGKVGVVAAFYPLRYVSEQVGGDRVAVRNLVRPGVEPHDLELQPDQMAAIEDADLVLYLRGFQPAVDAAVDQSAADQALDVAEVEPLRSAPPGAEEEPEGEEHSDLDPHVWLDPIRLATVGAKVADRLTHLDPDHAAEYRARADALRAELTALDREYSAGLAGCARREIVTSHAAFGYLAARYNLEQVPVSGLSPDEDPAPARLADVAKLVKDRGVTVIFFETLVSPAVAQTLARETGTKAERLDPIEGVAAGSADTYPSLMRDNLRTLQSALGCP